MVLWSGRRLSIPLTGRQHHVLTLPQCWLTIPILIYLVMVPMWSRARRFSNVYAFAALDSLSVVLWLSAWAAVASYVASGKGQGDNKKESGCDNFKYGSPGRCKLSEATIVLGVIIMLLFVGTAFISFRSVLHFKRTGMMPAATTAGAINAKHNDFEQTQDAFSSNMHTDDLDDDRNTDARQGGYAYQQPSFEDEYAPIHQADHDDIGHLAPAQPQSPLNPNGLGIHNYDTSYNGVYDRQRPVHGG